MAEMDDIMEGLEDQLQGLGVRSASSRQRQMKSRQGPVLPSGIQANSFYSPLGAKPPLALAAEKSTLDFDEDDAEDSTYEQESSSVETEEFTEGHSMEHEDEVDFCIPAEELAVLRDKESQPDDGASDYCPSDGGEGPDDFVDESTITASAAPCATPHAKYEKYLQRARMMLQCPSEGRHFGLPPELPFWVSRMARFSKDESRWVDKGPVMLYFIDVPHYAPRLVGNFLYGTRWGLTAGTKSTCIDLQLYEFIDAFWKLKQGNRLMFSTFGYNAVRHAEIITEKVDIAAGNEHTHVLQCRSHITNRQEPKCTEFTLKFPTWEGTAAMLTATFGTALQPLLAKVKHDALEKRGRSFLEPYHLGRGASAVSVYAQSQSFVEQVPLAV
ncbi:hypothetical protein HDU91_000060 [Kappamyces sp. JEL0680]|nr:hypothetical protein HDU91_000060 [Kappamyces sp. JEL0680]